MQKLIGTLSNCEENAFTEMFDIMGPGQTICTSILSLLLPFSESQNNPA